MHCVHTASDPVVAVVGDYRSGNPLHERCDKSDVYEGEVTQVDMVPELVGRFDGVIDGLRCSCNILKHEVVRPNNYLRCNNNILRCN